MGPLTLAELSEHLRNEGLPNEVRGDGERTITGCATLDAASEGQITFLANVKYRDRVSSTKASAIIMQDDPTLDAKIPQIICSDPYLALTLAIVKIHGHRSHPQWGMHAGAHVDSTATIGHNPNIAPGVTICAGASIGDNATIYPGVYIGPNVTIGDDVVLSPNIAIHQGCKLGHRVMIHAGTVIGEDGLGYAPVGQKWLKIPQAGSVEIGDDVEIGANCTIDRGTLGTTKIGSGSKFSNLICIGHGCEIGDDCMFVAQVGLAGSVTVGRHVTIAGQAGIVGHLSIGDNAQVLAQAGVNSSVKPGEAVLGSPAVPVAEARRQMVAVLKLPEMRNQLRQMEKEIASLKEALAESKANG